VASELSRRIARSLDPKSNNPFIAGGSLALAGCEGFTFAMVPVVLLTATLGAQDQMMIVVDTSSQHVGDGEP
jgi:hypothetical protein